MQFMITCEVDGLKDFEKTHWTFQWLNKDLKALDIEIIIRK